MLVSNGDQIPDAGANILADPMTPYRYSSNKSTKATTVYYPRPYDPERMIWRSLEPLIAQNEAELDLRRGEKAPRHPANLTSLASVGREVLGHSLQRVELRLISASYGPQASAAATTVDTRIGLPYELLLSSRGPARITVFTAARATRDAASALGRFGGMLLQAAGGDYAFLTTIADSLLTDLEARFTDWLRTLDLNEIDQACSRWAAHVRRTSLARAQELITGAGPRALIGRTVVENEHERHLSAGAAFMAFHTALDKALAPLVPDETKESPAATTPASISTPSKETAHG